MDRLRLRVLESDTGVALVEILINDQPLLDIVRAVEAPLCESELRERVLMGEPEDEVRIAPASYMYSPLGATATESFFGRIEDHFRLEAGDAEYGKTMVLGCDCGEPGCWPLLVRISANETTITWSDFTQFHRDWVYNFGPFNFDRDAYHSEFQRVSRRETGP